MAKKVVATLKQKGAGKGVAKVIKMVKSEKTGAYTFQEEIVATEEIKEFLAQNNNVLYIINEKLPSIEGSFFAIIQNPNFLIN